MAHFKTAYLQREEWHDVDVVGSAPLKVGDCVQLVEATASVAAYIQKSTFANATHIIAQSDQTIGYGHVPVENRDYRYNPEVAVTLAAAPATAETTTWKHVALYRISNNKADVILDADGGDVSA
jgi:hypothetical protein